MLTNFFNSSGLVPTFSVILRLECPFTPLGVLEAMRMVGKLPQHSCKKDERCTGIPAGTCAFVTSEHVLP